ncbi:MAG: hypothetical protein AAFO69_05060, partial [Bacteroidota bacterium]
HPIERNIYHALQRLIYLYQRKQPVTEKQVEHFYYLGGEHSLCREVITELLGDTLHQKNP